eukprot:TRINITY_DN4707_c0_g1_i2.p1 TRINITY_DN4707_c0_g1~~TRINITY_DN4707_c0_g1_i2.p1  ORF type:complete len:367 (-),score=72.98 TRINITY_DN4707_c0_g1_i2:117-1217(-)
MRAVFSTLALLPWAASAASEGAPKCRDPSVGAEGQWVVYNLSFTTMPSTCQGFSFGDKVPSECCKQAGGFNLLGQSFGDLFKEQSTSCPSLFGGQMNALMQCNADGSITYGEDCTSDCMPCNHTLTAEAGDCFKANDMEGTMWFVESMGCACPEPAPPCADKGASPSGEWYVYNLSVMAPPDQCTGYAFGAEVPAECCTSSGGFNMIGETWEQLYTGQQETTCPSLWGGAFNAFMQCNSDNTVTYGEHCTSNCSPCETVMTVGPGCFKANDLEGTLWFVKSQGCMCGDSDGKTTCGDVKKAYRESGCCKNPTKEFMPPSRRLSSSSSGDIAHAVTAKLRQKAAVAGPKAATKFAKEIKEMVKKFEA